MKRNLFFWLMYQPYKWFILFPCMLLSLLVFGALAIIIAIFFGERKASTIAGKAWGKFLVGITPVSVNIDGAEHIDPRQSYVIVSNHQSIYDILVLYGWLDIDFKWVMKAELRKIPGLGASCEKMGHIFIDRKNRHRAIATLNEAKKKITNGTSVIFFPEGTRSSGNKLRPFKKGAFHMAKELHIPILPITIAGTKDIHPTHTFDTFPGSATMYIHPPISVEDFAGNPGSLMEASRKAIASRLGDESDERECSRVSPL